MPYNKHMTELKTEKISKLFSNKTEYSILYTVQYAVKSMTLFCVLSTKEKPDTLTLRNFISCKYAYIYTCSI